MKKNTHKHQNPAYSLRLDLDEKLYQETIIMHPELKQWALLGREWLATVKANKSNFKGAIRKFFNNYLAEHKLPTNPAEFFSTGIQAPSLLDTCLNGLTDRNHIKWSAEGINKFLKYVLTTQFSTYDEYGHVTISSGYENPVPSLPSDYFSKRKYANAGGSSDVTFSFATKIDPTLETWRSLAESYLPTLRRGVSGAHHALGQFLTRYIHVLDLPRDPGVFLKTGYKAPCIYQSLFSHLKSRTNALANINAIRKFVDYVLITQFSSENDNGKQLVSPEFCNPLLSVPDDLLGKPINAKQESEKEVLPYKYIAQLREIICPKGSKSFDDWIWAQKATDYAKGSDWFYVDPNAIVHTDPDCVWRKRKTSGYEREIIGLDGEVYEIWSPVRAVALYVKLQLPLRTFQVRMLDSGEADTKRYSGGQWVENTNPLTSGSLKFPVRKGVFREMGSDNATHTALTGLFINTNKTADSYRDEIGKGYELAWQHDDVLYWLERLRNWQERYNPIAAPVAWTELTTKQLEHIKSEAMLKEMGSACFLFRHVGGKMDERNKPIHNSHIDKLWTKALIKLQELCEADSVLVGGKPMEFVSKSKPSDIRSLFPLHSLRVSLITAYALEGGVPMPVLSKCIAGHSRLIMTLYYTKVGISYVTDKMREAEKKLIETEQETFVRWLRDATHKQLEASGAFIDPQSLNAVLAAQNSGASFIKDDKGICPKGAQGCNSGGIYVNDETGVVSYGVVPGYPQKNCVQCRWFFTGPAFLPGLVDHWNNLSLEMGEIGDRIIDFEQKIMALEDEQYQHQEKDLPFTQFAQLDALRKYCQTEIERNNKNGTDLNSTLRLITRCEALFDEANLAAGVCLVAVGTQADVQICVNECSKLQQILTSVAGSIVFAEHDVSKAIMQVGKAYDMMLAMNGKQPMLYSLNDKELKWVVQHITILLQAQVGSIKDAVSFIEGQRMLSEIGIDLDVPSILKGINNVKLEFNTRFAQRNKKETIITSNSDFDESLLLEDKYENIDHVTI